MSAKNDQVILSFPLFFLILFLGGFVGWYGHCEYLILRAEWRETHKPRCAYSNVRGTPYTVCEDWPKHWLY